MQVHKYRENIAAATIADKKALDLSLSTHSKITIAMLATGANMRIKVNYIFDSVGTSSNVASGGGAQSILALLQQTHVFIHLHLTAISLATL